MNELCRICMVPTCNLINLVRNGTERLERSGEKFEDCFGIKVKELAYHQRICRECDKQLIDFYYFKQQALRSHNYLIDKAADLEIKCSEIKVEVQDEHQEDVQIKIGSPVEFFNIEYLDEEVTHVGPIEYLKKESVENDEEMYVKEEKDGIDSVEDVASEILEGYEQVESLIEENSESLPEERIEDEDSQELDNTRENHVEEEKESKAKNAKMDNNINAETSFSASFSANNRSMPLNEDKRHNLRPHFTCHVCFSDILYTHEEHLRCGHVFHQSCIREWFKTSQSCPRCYIRTDV